MVSIKYLISSLVLSVISRGDLRVPLKHNRFQGNFCQFDYDTIEHKSILLNHSIHNGLCIFRPSIHMPIIYNCRLLPFLNLTYCKSLKIPSLRSSFCLSPNIYAGKERSYLEKSSSSFSSTFGMQRSIR